MDSSNLLTIADELETPLARRELYKALVSSGVIPEIAPGALGGTLTNALQKSPPAVVESFPQNEAYQKLLDNLDAELKHTRSVGRTLLVLFCISVVFTIGFVAWAFGQGNPAKDIRTWVSAVPTAAIGIWNRANRRASERLLADLMRLAKARRK